jgi:hypothetical protein
MQLAISDNSRHNPTKRDRVLDWIYHHTERATLYTAVVGTAGGLIIASALLGVAFKSSIHPLDKDLQRDFIETSELLRLAGACEGGLLAVMFLASTQGSSTKARAKMKRCNQNCHN